MYSANYSTQPIVALIPSQLLTTVVEHLKSASSVDKLVYQVPIMEPIWATTVISGLRVSVSQLTALQINHGTHLANYLLLGDVSSQPDQNPNDFGSCSRYLCPMIICFQGLLAWAAVNLYQFSLRVCTVYLTHSLIFEIVILKTKPHPMKITRVVCINSSILRSQSIDVHIKSKPVDRARVGSCYRDG